MKKTRNKKVNQNPQDYTKKKCSFVGRIEWISRIVFYEGRVLEDLWEKVKCEMMDRYIHNSNDLFEIILEKKQIKLNS